MPTATDPVPRQRIADQDLDWSKFVDQVLEAERVAADGSERLRLAKTLARLAPGMTTSFDAGLSQADGGADFEQCLVELARG